MRAGAVRTFCIIYRIYRHGVRAPRSSARAPSRALAHHVRAALVRPRQVAEPASARRCAGAALPGAVVTAPEGVHLPLALAPVAIVLAEALLQRRVQATTPLLIHHWVNVELAVVSDRRVARVARSLARHALRRQLGRGAGAPIATHPLRRCCRRHRGVCACVCVCVCVCVCGGELEEQASATHVALPPRSPAPLGMGCARSRSAPHRCARAGSSKQPVAGSGGRPRRRPPPHTRRLERRASGDAARPRASGQRCSLAAAPAAAPLPLPSGDSARCGPRVARARTAAPAHPLQRGEARAGRAASGFLVSGQDRTRVYILMVETHSRSRTQATKKKSLRAHQTALGLARARAQKSARAPALTWPGPARVPRAAAREGGRRAHYPPCSEECNVPTGESNPAPAAAGAWQHSLHQLISNLGARAPRSPARARAPPYPGPDPPGGSRAAADSRIPSPVWLPCPVQGAQKKIGDCACCASPLLLVRGASVVDHSTTERRGLDLMMAHVHLSVREACVRRLQSWLGSLDGWREPEAAGGEASGVSPRLPRAAGGTARGVEGDGSVGFGRRRSVGGECGGRAGSREKMRERRASESARRVGRSVGGSVGRVVASGC